VLKERALDPMLPVMRAHGVPGLIGHLAGACSLDEAIARGQADTRAYVKRQFTWFRNQLRDVAWMAPADAETRLASGLQAALIASPSRSG
jgi:tRNA dimethylallyltransferase